MSAPSKRDVALAYLVNALDRMPLEVEQLERLALVLGNEDTMPDRIFMRRLLEIFRPDAAEGL